MSNRTNRITSSKPGLVASNSLACVAMVVLLCSLTACGGTKVLKTPERLVAMNPLATAADQNLSATLDWVIYRGGPGSWAENADWDEYLIRVQNLGATELQITRITVVDSLGTSVSPAVNRSKLVKGANETMDRYKGEGLEVKAGVGSGTLLVAGAVTGAAAVSAGGAAMYMGSAAAGGVLAGLALAPVLAVGGVMRGVNNSKVNNQIEIRQTLLPVQVPGGAERSLDVFYPLAPSPTQLEVTYIDASGEHLLIMDLREPLNGLHIVRRHD